MSFSTNTFSDSRFHEGSFVVYIAGVEAPVIAVDVDMGVWTIPAASITVAPDIELVGLGREDRVPVAVFFLDENYADTVDPQFRLIFDGYITGWAYNNTPRGRMISFSCVSDLSIIDELYPFFVTSTDSMVASAIMATIPNAIACYHGDMAFPASLLYVGFNPTKETIKRPYDLVENALRATLSIGREAKMQSVVTSNFYARFLRRFNTINRWAPSPIIESLTGGNGIFPILKALQTEGAIAALSNKMKEMSNGSSFWNVFQKIFLMMYYEILAITTPSIAQVTLAPEQRAEIVGPPKWMEDPVAAAKKKPPSNSTSSPFADPTMPNRLLQYITKPQWLFGTPPMCNTIFPSMIKNISFQEDYNAQPTRLGINDEILVNTMNQSGSMAAIATLRGGYPLKYQQELDKKFGDGTAKGNMMNSGKNFLIWPEEFFKGPRVSQELLPDWFGFLDDAIKKEFAGKPVDLETKRKQLAFSYANYEYERQRGATRRGGVDMIFNPYVVPGYTSMIFSDVASNQNYFVYITSVKHVLAKGAMQTSIGFTFAQTLDELMHNVLDAKKDKPEFDALVAAPLNPIVEVRNASQLLPNAETYFSKIFHQNSNYAGNPAGLLKTAAFDYRKAVQLVTQTGTLVSLLNEKKLREDNLLSKYTSVAPTKNYETCFKSPDAAMQLVSRPICTLEEYISWHGNGIRKNQIGRYDGRQGKGGVFYEEILSFIPGPGTEAPAVDINNNLLAEFRYDLRSDWAEKVRRYRHKIIFETSPQEA